MAAGRPGKSPEETAWGPVPACEGAPLTCRAAGLGQSAPGPQAPDSWEGLPSKPQAHPVPPALFHVPGSHLRSQRPQAALGF